jgi:hypothetical protein
VLCCAGTTSVCSFDIVLGNRVNLVPMVH